MYTIPCQYCKGHGFLPHFKHVQDGICFKCNGSKVEQVTKEVYDDYHAFHEQLNKGQYILFNNGSIEYYDTVKEIEEKYGNFRNGDYEWGWAVAQSYRDENIIYDRSTKDNDKFIKVVTEAYKNTQNLKVNKEILKLKNWMKNETDQEWITMLQGKINELETQIANF